MFSLAAKAFIVDNNRQILIIRRRKDDAHSPDVWELPGGRLKPGEDPRDGLKREVEEETGIQIEVLNPLSVHNFKRADGQKVTMIVFLCGPNTTEVKLSEEHTDFIWIPLASAMEKLDDHFHHEIDIYNEHFNNGS
jgi:8-oxo-dGTP diphosphatase